MTAPFATLPEASRGRRYPEEAAAHRSPFQRDRDRIIHSTRVPAAEAQDPGLRRARGGLLPHAADAFGRGGAGGADDRAGAGAERGAGRGGGAGARPRASAVRAYRRGRAEGADGAVRRVRPQRAGDQDRDAAGGALCRVRRAEPDLGDAGGDRQAQRAGDRGEVPFALAEYDAVHDLELGTHASAEAQVAAIVRRHRLQQPRPGGRAAGRALHAGGSARAAADRGLRRGGGRALAGAGAGAARARGAAAVLRAAGRGRAGDEPGADRGGGAAERGGDPRARARR